MNRTGQGKLITVWNPIREAEGCSTIASSLGIILKLKSGQRVLIVNAVNTMVRIENFVEEDIHTKYSLDNLKGLNDEIEGKDISAFSTKISEGLHLLSGPEVAGELPKEFIGAFINQSKLMFDYVIVDVGDTWRDHNEEFLTVSDLSISVIKPSEIHLRQLRSPSFKKAAKLIQEEKNIVIFNQCHQEFENEVLELAAKWAVNPILVKYSPWIYKKCNLDRTLYSSLYNVVDKGKRDSYVETLEEFSMNIVKRFDLELYKELKKQSRKGWFLKKQGKGGINEES